MNVLITYGVAFVVIWLTLIACGSTARWIENRKIRKARHQAYLDLMYRRQDRGLRRKRDHDEFRRNNPRPSRPLRPRDYE